MKKYILVSLLVVVLAVTAWLSSISNEEPEQLPSVNNVGVSEIFSTTDFKEGIKKAVQTKQEKEIDSWLSQALYVAQEIGLDSASIDYIQSQQARDYVVFQAKRSLFDDAFNKAYLGLEAIDDIKLQYPEAKDLFEKADALIIQRDKTIEEVAQTIASNQGEGVEVDEKIISYAKKMWIEKFAATDEANATRFIE